MAARYAEFMAAQSKKEVQRAFGMDEATAMNEEFRRMNAEDTYSEIENFNYFMAGNSHIKPCSGNCIPRVQAVAEAKSYKKLYETYYKRQDKIYYKLDYDRYVKLYKELLDEYYTVERLLSDVCVENKRFVAIEEEVYKIDNEMATMIISKNKEIIFLQEESRNLKQKVESLEKQILTSKNSEEECDDLIILIASNSRRKSQAQFKKIVSKVIQRNKNKYLLKQIVIFILKLIIKMKKQKEESLKAMAETIDKRKRKPPNTTINVQSMTQNISFEQTNLLLEQCQNIQKSFQDHEVNHKEKLKKANEDVRELRQLCDAVMQGCHNLKIEVQKARITPIEETFCLSEFDLDILESLIKSAEPNTLNAHFSYLIRTRENMEKELEKQTQRQISSLVDSNKKILEQQVNELTKKLVEENKKLLTEKMRTLEQRNEKEINRKVHTQYFDIPNVQTLTKVVVKDLIDWMSPIDETDMTTASWLLRCQKKDYISNIKQMPYSEKMCQGEWSYQKVVNTAIYRQRQVSM